MHALPAWPWRLVCNSCVGRSRCRARPRSSACIAADSNAVCVRLSHQCRPCSVRSPQQSVPTTWRRRSGHRGRDGAISTCTKRGNLIAGSRLVSFVDIVWITYPQRTQRLTWLLFGIVTWRCKVYPCVLATGAGRTRGHTALVAGREFIHVRAAITRRSRAYPVDTVDRRRIRFRRSPSGADRAR